MTGTDRSTQGSRVQHLPRLGSKSNIACYMRYPATAAGLNQPLTTVGFDDSKHDTPRRSAFAGMGIPVRSDKQKDVYIRSICLSGERQLHSTKQQRPPQIQTTLIMQYCTVLCGAVAAPGSPMGDHQEGPRRAVIRNQA